MAKIDIEVFTELLKTVEILEEKVDTLEKKVAKLKKSSFVEPITDHPYMPISFKRGRRGNH